MNPNQRDKTKVDPLSGSELPEPPEALKSVPPDSKPDASNATIPGTGEIIKDVHGQEHHRVIST